MLYGGTAVALQTGHRDSEDFDFFSSEALPEAVGAMRRIYGDQAPVGAAVAALAYFEGRTPSPQGALSQDRRVTIERAVAS